ncbi:hypothetical protein BUALT_Bualt01G0180500 [Buddleja alternifolia]|uniref:Peptidase A1 domain-containing protein n=1 Tax=Buddleja alternifolia TaxID=168488 RepID=A0AAV6Y9P7_9LAMI|nr:hypothetical protein BUALT_Bualt01G0180500 [Buddleja alternifolia]
MKLHTIPIACLAFIFAIFMPRCHVTEATGFSIDLIHRDSLQSPSLDSSLTTSQRVTNALQRSFNRVNTLSKDYSPQSTSAEIFPDRGEYLMKFSLGTPHVETLAIADTGSDLTWIQCKPCDVCFNQKAPLFDPSRSSTYKLVSCTSDACNALPRTSCNTSKGSCGYTIAYGDRSFSRGDLATETITLGSTTKENVSFPNVTIGCGHFDRGTFGAGASGIVGLGGGKVSLITQMGSSIQGKFSYCLIPYLGEAEKPSKMNFGDQAVVSGDGVVSTPIVAKSPRTFYFLTIEGITVGNQKLYSVLPSSIRGSKVSQSEGNIIIDSGTTLTFLPTELYFQVITAVKSQVKMRQIDDPQGLLSLCFLSRGNVKEELPEIIAHFKGADVKLKSYNTFIKTSQNSLCLAFAQANSVAIYGNLAQMDFFVGYDFEKKTVSFKPTDCSKA